MRIPEKALNSLTEHSKISDYKYERLYRILFNEEMFYVAYQNKYAKQGNMTAGTDGKPDRMSISRIEHLIERLKNETYQPHPARRVYIPKAVRKIRTKFYKNKKFSIPYTGSKGNTKYRVFYDEGFKRKTAWKMSHATTFQTALSLQ